MAAILAVLCFFVLVMAGYGVAIWVQQRLAARRDVLDGCAAWSTVTDDTAPS
jgi:hypothetical protein